MTTIVPNKCKPNLLKMPTKASPAPPPPRNQTPPDELAMLRAECDKWHKAYDRGWEDRMRLADRAIALEKEIAELKENHKKEVARLLMKISSLEKLIETANKIIKPKGGFTIKNIKFGGVNLEGIDQHKKEA